MIIIVISYISAISMILAFFSFYKFIGYKRLLKREKKDNFSVFEKVNIFGNIKTLKKEQVIKRKKIYFTIFIISLIIFIVILFVMIGVKISNGEI